MKTIQTARFRLSQLLEWVADRMENPKVSVSEALDFYFNWALGRGWALKAAAGSQVREPDVIFALDGGPQVAMMRDEIWSAIWESENADGDATFLDEWDSGRKARSAKLTAGVIDRLEAAGWVWSAEKDGYMDPSGAKLITSAQIYAARGADPAIMTAELIEASWTKAVE